MEHTIEQDEDSGGIPLMGSKGKPIHEESAAEPVLGEVKAQLKGKSNLNRLVVLAGIVGTLAVSTGALMFYSKYKKKAQQQPTAQVEAPAFGGKNEQLDNDFINARKKEIEDAEERKRMAEKEEEERLRQAELARASGALNRGAFGAPAPQASSQTASKGAEPAQYGSSSSAGQGGRCPDGKCPMTPDERKMAGDALLDLDGGRGQTRNEPVKAAGASTSDFPPRPGYPDFEKILGNKAKEEEPSIARQMKPTVMQARSAGVLSNLDYLLKRGTIIPCSLKTGIDTTLAGFVLCEVTNDVYSANGKIILVNRGAVLHGEQQSALKNGQARVFVLWTRMDNPDGTFAELDSPATDSMGFNGVGGYVDNHFAERFGAAILISIIKDATQFALSNLASNSQQQQFVPTNTANTGTSMAQDVLRNDMNIPPTLTVLPASRVNVLVSRDISFESVYRVIE